MIPLNNAMVLWNNNESAKASAGKPRIVVVDHRDNNKHLNFLRRSVGACYAGWRNGDPEKLAAHILATFALVTGRDGVPSDEAHQEFMKISEYREWFEQETGPFSDVYWSFGNAA